MATRNIALGINIKINGTQQSVKSIDELKTAITQLESEIQTAEFGSDEFNRLSGDLAKLKAGFRDINKEIEGADREQALGAFAASVNGVTGAFLVATSAIQAFGIEGKNAEELAKIQARALAAVNIALGIRQIVEAKVKFEQIQRNVVEKASLIGTRLLTAAQAGYTAVVAGTTGALKALRVALATTGIGLAVVAIGALISKLMSAKEETEDLSKETKTLSELQKETAQSSGVEILKIQQLAKVLKDTEKPQNVRREIYKDLTKLVPELAGYTLDEAEATGILNQAINDQIDLIRLRAKERALEDFLVQLEKERIAAELDEQAKRKQIQSIIDLNKVNVLATQIMKGMGAATFEQAQEMARAQLIRTGEIEQIEDQNVLEKQLLENREEQAEILSRQTKRTQDKTKATKESNDADNKAIELQKERLRLLQLSIKALGEFNLEGEVSAKVLEDANKVLEKQNDLLEERKGILQEQKTAQEQLAIDFTRLIGGALIPEKEIIEFRDIFQELFEQVQKGGGTAVEQYEKLVKVIKQAGGAEKVRSLIGEESLEVLQDYFDTNVDLVNLLGEYNTRATTALGTNAQLVNLNIDLNKLVKEISDIQIEDANNLERKEVTQRKITQLITASLFPQQDGKELTEEQLQTIDSITKSLIQQTGLYRGIFDVNQELARLTKEIKNNVTEQEKSLDKDAFKNLRQFIIDNADSVETIEDTFKTISEGSSNLTEEQIANINQLISDIKLNNLVDDIDEVAQKVVQLFSQVSGQISSIVSQQNSLALEQLQYQEELTLATIGDATEEARKEQERVQKQFAEDRFNLEKRARISELQFALADSIANGAAAYISALTVAPPAGFLLAQLVGGITAAQIAVINSQIGFAKSKQFIARRGGLIQGASHEQGGIMANGGLVVEGGEAILNRNAVSQFSDILSQMSMSTGGRPLVADDSRIVEEIRRQNQRPIKTYVLDQDIQDTRKINARLEQISRL